MLVCKIVTTSTRGLILTTGWTHRFRACLQIGIKARTQRGCRPGVLQSSLMVHFLFLWLAGSPVRVKKKGLSPGSASVPLTTPMSFTSLFLTCARKSGP